MTIRVAALHARDRQDYLLPMQPCFAAPRDVSTVRVVQAPTPASKMKLTNSAKSKGELSRAETTAAATSATANAKPATTVTPATSTTTNVPSMLTTTATFVVQHHCVDNDHCLRYLAVVRPADLSSGLGVHSKNKEQLQ